MNSAEDRQPRPQGAFPWLCMRWAREKRLGTRLEDRIKEVVLFQQENAYSGIPSRLLGD